MQGTEAYDHRPMVLSDVAAHIDAALVVRSSEPRGLATRLPG